MLVEQDHCQGGGFPPIAALLCGAVLLSGFNKGPQLPFPEKVQALAILSAKAAAAVAVVRGWGYLHQRSVSCRQTIGSKEAADHQAKSGVFLFDLHIAAE